MKGQNITYPYIGVQITEGRKSYYSTDTFVYIVSVEKNSPAKKGGLKANDIILEVNDVKVSTAAMFKHELYKHQIGEEVKIKVERDGEEKTLVVKLGSQAKTA